MSRYRAIVAYDGTDYCGFQKQAPSQPTIQGELEGALSDIAASPVTVTGAGRTDSGVHALGQVVSFNIAWRHDEEALLRATNAHLPDDIALTAVSVAAPSFHPRFDARRRAYEYHVYNRPVRNPLQRRYSWHVHRPLDLQAMNAAAAAICGTHDFATFGQAPQGENTVRHVFHAAWRDQGHCLVFDIEGNAFLYRMVRSIVGTLRAVGHGERTVEDFVTSLQAADRSLAATTAPPHGLFLASVTYD
jgi:tRNA pseudouridine38-40 synthase